MSAQRLGLSLRFRLQHQLRPRHRLLLHLCPRPWLLLRWRRLMCPSSMPSRHPCRGSRTKQRRSRLNGTRAPYQLRPQPQLRLSLLVRQIRQQMWPSSMRRFGWRSRARLFERASIRPRAEQVPFTWQFLELSAPKNRCGPKLNRRTRALTPPITPNQLVLWRGLMLRRLV